MSAVFTPTRLRISVDRYQKMVAAGVLTQHDRIELIDGDLIDMAPMGTRHVSVTAQLHELFTFALQRAATITAGSPVKLGDFSEPQPDLILLRRREDFYSNRLPEACDVLLVVEVSDSSLAFDQGIKRALYARSGVSEYWVIDLNGRRIAVYLEPSGGSYTRSVEYRAADTIHPQAFPNACIALAQLRWPEV